MAYTVWKTSSPWEKEALDVVLAVAGLRVVKEVLNMASPAMEMRRQPAQFDRNDDCVRQVCIYVYMFVCMCVCVCVCMSLCVLVCVCASPAMEMRRQPAQFD